MCAVIIATGSAIDGWCYCLSYQSQPFTPLHAKLPAHDRVVSHQLTEEVAVPLADFLACGRRRARRNTFRNAQPEEIFI